MATIVFAGGIQVLLAGLTPAGVATSWILGGAVYSAFGWSGFILVCLYFILGSAATKLRLKEKTEKGIAEKRGGRRGPVRYLGGTSVPDISQVYEHACWAVGMTQFVGNKIIFVVETTAADQCTLPWHTCRVAQLDLGLPDSCVQWLLCSPRNTQ
jgi:uncharacterized membrane protein